MNQREIFQQIRSAGWSIEKARRGGHFKIRDNAGRCVATASNSPSDGRAVHNLLADLRRGGLDIR